VDPRLLALAYRQGGVFSAAQAARYGCGPNELRRLLRHMVIHSVQQGIYCPSHLIDRDALVRHRVRCAAVLLARGNPAVDGRPVLVAGSLSAAALWQLTVPRSLRDLDPKVTTVLGPGDGRTPWVPKAIHLISGDRVRRTYRRDVHVCPAALAPEDIAFRDHLPLTALARTAIDLCRHSTSWPDAVIVADSALSLGLDKVELEAAAARAAGWRGGTTALRAAAFADARSQSAAESRARALFAEHDALTGFDLQVRIGDANGFIAQVDFLFREHRTIVEIDGKVKYTDPWRTPGDVLWNEKLREDRLRDAGFEVVRVTWKQLVTEPGRVIERILAAFARAARRAA
jgi:very-short-patch-repair endonuclease